jgi:two-component system, cell cycle sensor histidine kinase and response regulator CckA
MFSDLKPIPFYDPPSPATDAGLPGFEQFFHRSPLPMWIFDIKTGDFLEVNAEAVKRYGWTREEFLQKKVDGIRPDADILVFKDYRSQMESVAASGLPTQDPWEHFTKNGDILFVETAWQLIDFHGRRAALVTITDRTALNETEEENQELAQVLNLAANAIIVCNLEREILFWNLGAEKIYGWTPDEVLGRSVLEVLGIDVNTALTCITTLIDSGEWAGEMKQKRRDETEAIVEGRWTLARDADSRKPKSILIINSDVTETRKLESRFLRSQRLESIGTLASGVAHDLNNILSPIMMAVGFLRQTAKPADHKMLGIIEASATRGAGIVKQVLSFARGADGERVMLQPKHLAVEMVKVMQQTFPRNIDIQTNFPTDIWMVCGDSTQIHQILLNLCVNARDAMGEKGGVLRIAIENTEVDKATAENNADATAGPHVCFTVKDSGTGMTPEVMRKIFNPFFTTKEQGKGTGLGLSTVFDIVKSHKGFITIQSSVGIGTTFKVFIPADREAKADQGTRTSIEALRGNGEIVLVVDDEAPVRDAIVGTLEAHNYRCFTAEDGTDALALYFERREIAIVVSDLHMGMMDGIMLTRSLQKLNPAVKVIISSGHLETHKRLELEALGVKYFLEKPYTADKLLHSLKELTSAAGSQ